MAQLDTGLGWSAKDNWLADGAPVTVAKISGWAGAVKLPAATNDSELLTNGLRVGTYLSGSNHTIGIYVGTGEGNEAATCLVTSGSTNQVLAVSMTARCPIYYYRYDETRSETWIGTQTDYTSSSELVPGLYGVNLGTGPATSTSSQDIPVYTNTTTALNSISMADSPFLKVVSGYAVACVAKWRTQANVVIQSPVLISSKRPFTEMSTSGQYQFATYNTRRDGMTFYMSFYQDIADEITTTFPVYDISGPEEPYANLDELFNLLCATDQANIKVTETIDPYEEFPHTEEDAGETDPDPEDDDIEEVDLPTMSFATAGFCRIYRPSFAQVSALASYMWTDNNFLQTVINHLKQILENPIDAIISLSIVPCTPNVLADEEVKVMYVPTGVYMPPVQRQFVSVDCGTYTLKEMYGSALDYNPYTSVQLYLPYVGIVQLDTDEVMGKTISIGYRIDVVTGVCCAYVKAGADVLYQFSGHCSIQQPITSADFSGYINAALAAGKLVASIAAAGAGAPAVAATLAGAPTPSISGSESKTVETERNPNTGRQITVGTRKRESQTYNPGASFGEVATRGVSNTVGAVMNSKTIVQHSGGFSGNSGFMAAVRRPYLIVTRPRIANPENYGQYNGRPSMIYLNLGDCTGFTQVQSIQLTGIDATNPELSEIATLLNSGVIL